jgi:NitT/TauT family transport system substrate-binding protein
MTTPKPLPARRRGQRHVFAALTLSMSTLLALLTHPVPHAAGQTPYKAGISDPVNTVLAMYMADAAGFYAAQGLKVEIINMNGGSRGAEELRAGRLDNMHVGLSSVVRVNRAGGGLCTIASLSNAIRFVFFSAPGIKSGADLKGGVIGVSTFGSESDSTASLVLRRLGLTRDDVTLRELGGGSRRLAAVKSGEVQATPLNEPFSSFAREQGVNPLIDLVKENVPWLFSSLVVRREDLSTRRDLHKRFIKATIEGNYLAVSQPAQAKAVLANELKISDPKLLDISYEDFKAQTPLDTEPSEPGAANILALFPDVSQSQADYIDTSLLQELKAEGFMTAMKTKYQR